MHCIKESCSQYLQASNQTEITWMDINPEQSKNGFYCVFKMNCVIQLGDLSERDYIHLRYHLHCPILMIYDNDN